MCAQVEAAKNRLSAGLLFKAGYVVLDYRVLDLLDDKEKQITSSNNEGQDKAIVEYHKGKEEPEAVLSIDKQWSDMTVTELKAVVHWKKRKTDKSVPGVKVNLQERYNEIVGRADRSLEEFLADTGHHKENQK